MQHVGISNQNLRWIKPATGKFKCNVDAATFQDQNFYGVSACLRNDQGKFIQTLNFN